MQITFPGIARRLHIARFALSVAVALLAGCASTPGPVVTAPAQVVAPPVATPKILPRIGLALGGGAARGFAHVGVIEVLEEAGLRPQLVVGTSAGSFVGALYASGKSVAELRQISQIMEEAAFADWTLPLFSRGMLRGEALARYVNVQVGNKPIEAFPIRFGAVATDLNSGQGVLIERGDTGTAVRASSAVPSVFQPVKINGHEYVDGGLVSPVPVRFARSMGAEVVVAVDISSDPMGNPAGDSLQILLQTFSIMSKSINAYELKDADVVVSPSLRGVGSADFTSRKRAIEAGRAAMLAALPQLRRAIEMKSH